ncbi:MAG: peptidylprolyl isomerase [Bacteroidetes bacterium]|nr:peptidylprolyl isomerase [Bacteroidota bacterium]MDA0938343.1 peptidylprolyl isomerase [Bacteroidota bacterium]MDA1344934.1 peptidylprolyl isomerase [Bacteroidota bacterium]
MHHLYLFLRSKNPLNLLCLLFILAQCESSTKPTKSATPNQEPVEKVVQKSRLEAPAYPRLTDKNAIPFFKQYAAENKENKVRIETRYGNIDILLYEDTPYHRANFVYLTKRNYFDGSIFHRVVPGFIIQGGNSDSETVMRRRTDIGRYLLPPDTRKGHKHHRGVISMPSSAIDNPHKLASPYEFFIVQQSPGAYHLDGNYTAFGEVIAGMEVVDSINAQKTDDREMPIYNIPMKVRLLQ